MSSLVNPFRFAPGLPTPPVPGPVVGAPVPILSYIADLGGGWWRVENYGGDGTIRFNINPASLLVNRVYLVTFSCRVLVAGPLDADFCDVDDGAMTGGLTPGNFQFTGYRANFTDPYHFVDLTVGFDEDEYYGMAEVSTPLLFLLPP